MGTQSNTLAVQPQRIITGQEDSGLDNGDAQFHAFSDTDPPAPGAQLTLTLPHNPQLGQSHKIVAATAAVALDGNGNTITQNGAPFVNPLAVGGVVTLTFTQDPAAKSGCGCDGESSGTWIAH